MLLTFSVICATIVSSIAEQFFTAKPAHTAPMVPLLLGRYPAFTLNDAMLAQGAFVGGGVTVPPPPAVPPPPPPPVVDPPDALAAGLGATAETGPSPLHAPATNVLPAATIGNTNLSDK